MSDLGISPPAVIGFDAAQDVTRVLDIAKSAGVGFIGRYYSFNARKNLTAGEASAILDAGLDIVSVWEARGDRPESFTEANGTREGAAALAQAKACGQPSNTAIYFAVDFDVQEPILPAIYLYFQAVNAELAGHYKVGVYGSGLVCSRLDEAGLVSYDWLAGAMGWQGSRAYAAAHLTEIEQGSDSDPFHFGFNVDQNTAPLGLDFGSWRGTPSPGPAPTPPAPIPPAPTVDIFAQVIILQQALKDQGYLLGKGGGPGVVDGDPGPMTYGALREWWGKRGKST